MAIVVSGFNLDNYVDVPTRLGMALKKYPDLRIQETHREIIEMPDKSCFIRCTVTVCRDATDPIPSIASACEIYPGRTPYTQKAVDNNLEERYQFFFHFYYCIDIDQP